MFMNLMQKKNIFSPFFHAPTVDQQRALLRTVGLVDATQESQDPNGMFGGYEVLPHQVVVLLQLVVLD